MKKLMTLILITLLATLLACQNTVGSKKSPTERADGKLTLVFEGEIDRIEVFTSPGSYDHMSLITMKDGRSVACYRVPMNPVSSGNAAYIYKNQPRNNGWPCSIFSERQSQWE